MLPARLRTGTQWSDTCILNISSRGLMIHSARALAEGSTVEVRRGDHAVVARIVWRDGARVGLQSVERVPVEALVSLTRVPTVRISASNRGLIERRKQPRQVVDARLRGRAIEFLRMTMIAAFLAISGWLMLERALARPLAQVYAILAS